MTEDGYEEYVRSAMGACRCCVECSDAPCVGTLTGGECDQSTCSCFDHERFHGELDLEIDDEDDIPW